MKEKKKVFLLSPDLHLCASFTLLLKNRFKVVTSTEQEFAEKIIELIQPDLFIADMKTNNNSVEIFQKLKVDNPKIKVILFLDSWVMNKGIESRLKKVVDAIYYQPIDLTEVDRELDLITS